MKKHLAKILILLLFSIVQGCKKDNSKPVPEVNIDCTAFTAAIVAKDEQRVTEQVNTFFNTRVPKPTNEDPWGFEVHLNSMVAQINSCSGLYASSCYACFQTYPPTGSAGVKLADSSQVKGVSFFLHHNKTESKYNVSLMDFH